MDIINNKDTIVNNLNNIVTSYVELDIQYNKAKKDLGNIQDQNNIVLHNLNNSLDEKDSIISKLNRDKVEYENIINGLNDKIELLLNEKESENKHSILVNQANQLEEKDRVIEQLQNKLSKYLDKVKYDDSIKIFTDGACSNNGNENAMAGIGVYFGENDIRNVSERIDGSQTNNIAELRAIIKVFDICKSLIDSNKKITIYTDSMVSIRWCSSSGEKYNNLEWKSDMGEDKLIYIKTAYELFKKYKNVTLEYVKAHTNNTDELSIGNRMADKLATDSLKHDDTNEDLNDKSDDKYDDKSDDKSDEDLNDIINDKNKLSIVTISNNIISETVIDNDNKEISNNSKQDLSDDDDEVWIKVKHKKNSYFIVKNESPQYIYSIMDNNKKGNKIGYREMNIVNGKKKYKYTFY